MKRDYFEWLWEQCSPDGSGIVLDPELQGIDPQIRAEWIDKGIISNEHSRKLKSKDKKIKGLVEVIIDPMHGYVVKSPLDRIMDNLWNKTNIDQYFKYMDYIIIEEKAFNVNRDKLTEFIAPEWEIEPLFWLAPPCGYMVGWKNPAEHVVVLAGEIDKLLLPTVAHDIKENLEADSLWLIETGSTRLYLMELKRLYKKGIHFCGTQDFLSEEGKPNWDINPFDDIEQTLMPVSPLSYDEDSWLFKYGEIELRFTPLESRCLSKFQTNFGSTISKDDLANVLWTKEEEEPDNPDHAIEAHISNIRQKLEENTPLTINSLGNKQYALLYKSEPEEDLKES